MASHTPGPWEHSDTHIFALTDEHDEVICRADGVQDWRVTPDPERAAANIRLMAHSPELLAALEELADLYDGEDGSVGGRGAEALAQARAAIRAAKGE